MPNTTTITPPRPLPEIVTDLGTARGRIETAARTFDRDTLPERIWIGVCCLAVQEHHAVPNDGKRGNQHSKKGGTSTRITASLTTPETLHPQGFIAWLTIAEIVQPTAYKYMDAARGAGLTAYSTESDTRKAVTALIKAHEKAGDALAIGALAKDGKKLRADIKLQTGEAVDTGTGGKHIAEQLELDLIWNAHNVIANPLIELSQLRHNHQDWQDHLDHLPLRRKKLSDGREVLGLEEIISMLTETRDDAVKRHIELKAK